MQSLENNMTHVTLQPNQREALPDSEGNIAGEVPPAISEQIMQMIGDFKKTGQIPKDADDYQLMMTMHGEMLKEREAMMKVEAGRDEERGPNAIGNGTAMATSNPALRHAQMLESARTDSTPPTQGSVSIPMVHSHDHQSPSVGTEDLSIIIPNLINQNKSAINDKDTDGDTPLHRVCLAGEQQLAHLLLVNGADCESRNNLGQTPLLLAAKTGQLLIMQLLIDNGADVAVSDSNGWTALHHAASGNAFLSPATVRYLTECCGLSFSALTNDGQTVLHIIAKEKKDNNRELLPMFLCRLEIDIALVDFSGNNAMHYAAEQCQPHMCYLFACRGGAGLLLTSNRVGKTPLDIAKNLPTLEGFSMYQEMEAWAQKGQTFKPCDSTPSVYLRQIFVPPVVLLIFVILSRVLTPNWQGFLSIGGFGIYFILVMKSRARINHLSRLPDPARLSGFVTGYIFFTCVLVGEYATIIDMYLFDYSRMATLLIICLCLIVSAVLYYRLITGDPGFTYESKRKESGEYYTMRDLVSILKRPGVWCPTCQLIPTKPSKHCKLCNRCVYKMDHHCLYTMRCVGYRNHYTFVWFMIVLVVGLALVLSLFPGYIDHLEYHDPRAFSENRFTYIFMHFFRYEGSLFIVLTGMTGVLMLTIHLLYQALRNISNGYTAYFNPSLLKKSHVSSLSVRERLTNIISFLATGKIKEQDANFVI